MTPTEERLWFAGVALLLAFMCAAWVYGLYCYVQMVRHRLPGVPASSMLWPAQYLDNRGRAFRRRALLSYAAFGVLAFLLILINQLQPTPGGATIPRN
ncbi:MAG TPA: hypothetical protein VHG52_06115 [Thermomicrobiales bacterium]|nr:hypothetical protein [Thermomicrobiales bacterium]